VPAELKENTCVFIVEHCDIAASLRRYRSDESCNPTHRLMVTEAVRLTSHRAEVDKNNY
jgi:hypothetical protein